MKSPKLTCQITGNSRVTSEKYLRNKAERIGKSLEWLLENYVSKQICSQLRKGKNISELTDMTFSDSRLTDLVKNNSKSREEFTFVDGLYTVTGKAPKAAKAPKVVKEEKAFDETTLETVVKEAVANTAQYEWCPEKETTVLKSSEEVLTEMVEGNDPF